MATSAQIRNELIAVRAQRDRFTAEALEALAPDVVEICQRLGSPSHEATDRPGERALRYLREVLPHLAFHDDPEQADRRRSAFELVCFDTTRDPLVRVRERAAGQLGVSKLSVRRHEDAAIETIAERLASLGGGARHQLVIITGQPGVGRDHAATQLAWHLKPTAPIAEVITVEDELREVAIEEGYIKEDGAVDDRVELYNLDQRSLRRLWARTLVERIGPRLANAIDHGDVVLSMAAVRYHIPSASIFSPADAIGFRDLVSASEESVRPRLELALGRAIVITIIDDAYDVFARLTVPRPNASRPPLFSPDKFMFGGVRRRPRRSVVIQRILEWRTAEVNAAEAIARSLRTEHVVMPAKYDVDSLAGIVEGLPRCYLSHSLDTAFRPDDAAAAAVADQAKRIAHRLRSERLVLFDSAAIDEDRFLTAGEERQDDRVEVTDSRRLRDRWRSLRNRDAAGDLDQSLWEPLPPRLQAVADQPFADHDEIWGVAPWPAEVTETLENLQSVIRNQTLWVNRRLLNQSSDAIFFLRPYFGGAGGMRRITIHELELAAGLRELAARRGSSQRPARPRREVLYHPRGDEVVRRNAALVEQFCDPASSEFTVVRRDAPSSGRSGSAARELLDLYQASPLVPPPPGNLARPDIDTGRIRTLEQLARHFEGHEADEDDHMTIGAAFLETVTGGGDLQLLDRDRSITSETATPAQLVHLGHVVLRCESGQPAGADASTPFDRPDLKDREWTERDWSSGGTDAVVEDLLQKAGLLSRVRVPSHAG